MRVPVCVLGGEPTSEEPTPVMLTALQALEACGTTAPVIVMSSTAVTLPEADATLWGKHFSAVELCVAASHLSATVVRTPWMLEHVFDETKQVREGKVSMFLPVDTQFRAVSMKDVSLAVGRMLIDPSSVSTTKLLTFSGPLLCMRDIATALTEVVGKPVEYHQLHSRQAYLDSLTTKNTYSNFDVIALLEMCDIIQSSSQPRREGSGVHVDLTTSTSDEGSAVDTPPPEPPSQSGSISTNSGDAGTHDLEDFLKRRGHFFEIFGDQAQPALSSVLTAMKELPLLKMEQKRGEEVGGASCVRVYDILCSFLIDLLLLLLLLLLPCFCCYCSVLLLQRPPLPPLCRRHLLAPTFSKEVSRYSTPEIQTHTYSLCPSVSVPLSLSLFLSVSSFLLCEEQCHLYVC